MPQSIKQDFENTKFSKKTLREALALIERNKGQGDEIIFRLKVQEGKREITYSDDLDGWEDFLLTYERQIDNAHFSIETLSAKMGVQFELSIFYYCQKKSSSCSVTVRCAPKSLLHEALQIFEDASGQEREEFSELDGQKPCPVVFIGHGRSNQWRDLKDHLKDQHNIEVMAYETGARAGHTIRDILEDMSGKSNMAFLVLTAEDQMADNEFQARPNVIHETGLFQGKLGFSRAIVLLEDGCGEFSNLAGIQQLRFSKDNIKEVFGDVLATIKREFP